jgi:hydrogenase maturation protease
MRDINMYLSLRLVRNPSSISFPFVKGGLRLQRGVQKDSRQAGMTANARQMIMTKVKDILILGIGNILLKDEGIGVHVVKKMKELPMPGNVEILDGGTAGLDLTDFIANRKKVIVIDTVKAGEKPGTIYRLTEKNLRTGQKAIMSFHEIDFLDALYMSEVMGEKPEETVVIGIEPKDMSDGTELSPEIEERIPKIIDVVMKELNSENNQ